MSATPTPQSPRRRAEELVAALADRIGARMTASTVYGEPIERDGVTVVPVATVRFAFGGGGGADPAKSQEGEGGGGGGIAAPAGYIELKQGKSRFVPVVHPFRMLAVVLGALLAALALVRPGR